MTPEILGRAIGEAADPELARVALSRVETRPGAREFLERPDIVPAAARLLGFSTAAADFFLAHPEELGSLADLEPKGLDALLEEVAADGQRLGPKPGLRRFRRRAAYRIAARDLAGAPVEEVLAELTAVAEAALIEAARLADARGETGLAVVGMGKLGGRELNYSSDVDVLFVHREQGGPSQERATRAAATVIDLLSEPTADGIALRVDPDLRPEGRSGPLSRSLPSMLEYYERFAATWERQALLKARPVAGDLDLGRAFVDGVAPFVYPAVLPASAIDEVRATKGRIEELVRARGKEATELKRGRGGIRDVEFAVQLLQLVHGRRHERLREAGTLQALHALAEEGFVASADAEVLAASYRFLRALEHRLQMMRDLQTHELPGSRAARWPLARAMGLSDPDHLMAEYLRHTDTVRGLHERLFYRPLLEAFAQEAPRSGDRTDTEELLAGLGFADPSGAFGRLARIVDPSYRLGRVLGTLFPVILPALAYAAAPDSALVRFERLADVLRAGPGLADHLAEQLPDRPDAARRLAALVAVSSAFGDVLVAGPKKVSAMFDPPAGEGAVPLFRTDPQLELLRVAGASAAGELRVPEVGRHLAAVADGVIASAVDHAAPDVPLAVLAMGRLGAGELSFGSDLDVVFVYDGDGREDFAAAVRAAERVMDAIRDTGWTPDPDLRPEGRNGPLVRTMASYLEYWQRWAETWEFQSLLRTRFVAGDEGLGRRFLSNAADFAFPEALAFEQVAAIRRMRVRMEEERVRPAEARRFHLKLGYGSLADVQFAVELALMRHGFDHPQVRRTNTLDALEALAEARLIEDSVAQALGEGYVFLMEIKVALELERRLPVESIPPAPEAQAALARRLGYDERARHAFLQDYRRITRRVRQAMERVFYPDEA